MKPTVQVVLATILLGFGCTATPERDVDPATRQGVRSAVEGRLSGFFQAMEEWDLDYLLGFYANADDFVFAGYPDPPVGYDEYAEVIRNTAGSGLSVTSVEVLGSPQIVVLSESAASCSFEFAWTMSDPEGNLQAVRGAWVFVFKTVDGEWRVVHSAGTHTATATMPGQGS